MKDQPTSLSDFTDAIFHCKIFAQTVFFFAKGSTIAAGVEFAADITLVYPLCLNNDYRWPTYQ